MFKYWAAFRIKADATYDARYDGLLDAMIEIRQGSWAELTSLWLFSSSKSIDHVTLALSKPLNAQTDLLVVSDLSGQSVRFVGDFEHIDIFKEFLPAAKKLG